MPIEVQVIDKPSAPEGPLKVSDVTSQMCVLAWQPPKDDGGSPIENYVIEKMDVARGEWTSVRFHFLKFSNFSIVTYSLLII